MSENIQSRLLGAVRARIVNACGRYGLTERTVFVAVEEPHECPAIDNAGDLIVTIYPDGGTFDAEAWNGGGRHSLHEHTGVVVSIWTKVQKDECGKAWSTLTDERRGLLTVKSAILDALAGVRLDDSDGVSMTADYGMRPVDSSGVQKDGRWSCLRLRFAGTIRWLTGGPDAM